METLWLYGGLVEVKQGRERTERRKAMETWFPRARGCRLARRRERTERRKAMETRVTAWTCWLVVRPVGNALNAERQW